MYSLKFIAPSWSKNTKCSKRGFLGIRRVQNKWVKALEILSKMRKIGTQQLPKQYQEHMLL